MNPGGELVAHAVKLALCATLLGLIVRGAYRLCWPFTAYLVCTLLGNTLVTTWPARFYTYEFWVAKQGVYDLLKLAIGVDIAYRVFRSFPGAFTTARRLILVALLAIVFAITRLPFPTYSTPEACLAALAQWHPRVLSGTIWLYTLTTLLIVWFRLPVLSFHRRVLISLTAYLFVFTELLRLFGLLGWRARDLMNSLEGLSYLAVVGWWAYVAWTHRRDERLLSPAATARLAELRRA